MPSLDEVSLFQKLKRKHFNAVNGHSNIEPMQLFDSIRKQKPVLLLPMSTVRGVYMNALVIICKFKTNSNNFLVACHSRNEQEVIKANVQSKKCTQWCVLIDISQCISLVCLNLCYKYSLLYQTKRLLIKFFLSIFLGEFL